MNEPRPPDQNDVARLAGVSVGSVSTAINQPHRVSERMLARVQKAIDELGYIPNRAAANLKRGGANRVLGLLIPDVTNAFYAAIADAVADAADRHNYAVSLCVTHEDPERERRHVALLAQQRAAGALVVPISPDTALLSRLRTMGTRLILVDRATDPTEGCSISVDDVEGGRLAVEHLLVAPGDGIALVNGSHDIPQCRQRWEGSLKAIREAGLGDDALSEIVVEEMSIDGGIQAARQLLDQKLPRRVFCINDQLATGLIDGLADAGLSAPDDARVIGYGDLGLANGHRLSTIGQPKHEMGDRAVELLLDELANEAGHHHSATVFQPHLLVRESSAVG